MLVLISTLLGFWFGLTPGFYGLHVGLLALALVLNIHLGLFLMSAALGKAVALAAAPLLYHTGLWMQDDAAGFIGVLANVPILGITDYSRYAVSGALLLGPLVGAALGAVLATAVTTFRSAWLKLDEGSEAFRSFRQKGWVRFLDWLLIGKARDPRETLKRRPRLVRIPGVVLALLLVVGAAVGAQFATDEMLARHARASLTAANGAEVDLASVNLGLFRGSVAAGGIAATDPDQPTHNRVQAEKLAADVSLWNLSLGKVVMDEVNLTGVAFDKPRGAPGAVLSEPPLPEPSPFDPARFGLPSIDAATLESYVKEAKSLRERLQRVREYLPAPDGEAEPPPPGPPQHYLEYLSARAARPPSPRLLIRKLVLDPVAIPLEQLGSSRLVCENLSDAPQHAAAPLSIAIESHDRPAKAGLVFHYEAGEGGVEVSAELEDVDLRALQTDLRDDNPVSFEAGKASVRISGRVNRDRMDLSIAVKTRDMKLRSGEGGLFDLDPQIAQEVTQVLQEVETTLRLVGPIDQPRLVFDSTALKREFREALVKAGKQQLVSRMDALIGDKLPEGVPDAGKVLDDPLGAAGEGVKEGLGGLIGGKDKKDDKKKDPKKDEGENPLDALKKRIKKP